MTSIINILDEINTDPKLILKYKDNPTIKAIFEYAFLPEKKFLLPEGKPPFRPVDVPYTLRSANFMNEVRRFYIFTKERSELSTIRREALFIQLLEILHEYEANLMVAIKDQTLPSLYENITYELLEDNGILPIRPKQEIIETKVNTEELVTINTEVEEVNIIEEKPKITRRFKSRKSRKSV